MKWIKNNFNIVLGFIIILIFVIGLFFHHKTKIYEYSSNLFYMDTYIQVKIYDNNEKKANQTLQEVDKIYKEYHELTDRYQEYDGIINLYTIHNNEFTEENLTIDEKLYNLLEYSLSFYEKTNKLININMGNVIDIWKRYRDSKTGIPTIEELQNAGSISIEDIVLLENNKIKNTHPNIDLGAISKGYTTNIVAKYLENKGYSKYLINAGGNVMVGDHYDNETYKIGIETPTIEGGVYQIIKGNNMAVTTSGSYARFYIYDNHIYHHIIDPNTLYPPHYMKSVTVITEDSSLGDILSTTLFLMPIEDGKQFLEENYPEVEAIWYGNNDQIYKTEGFNKYE